jgi:hypothetical protein
MRGAARGRPGRYRLPALLFCLYAPYAWLLTDDFPWSDYHWTWTRLWPVLPGLPVAALLHPMESGLGDRGEFLVMAAVTSAIVAGLTYLARRRRPNLVVLAAAVALLSSGCSWIAYALYRA